jgi:hypothetical protein
VTLRTASLQELVERRGDHLALGRGRHGGPGHEDTSSSTEFVVLDGYDGARRVVGGSAHQYQ